MLAAIVTIAIIEVNRFILYLGAGVALPIGILSALRDPPRKKFLLSKATLWKRKTGKVMYIWQL